MSAENAPLTDFESQLEALEKLVHALEEGDIGLEQAVRNFEQGMELAQRCEGLLKAAELRVQKLIDDGQGERLVEIEGDESGDGS